MPVWQHALRVAATAKKSCNEMKEAIGRAFLTRRYAPLLFVTLACVVVAFYSFHYSRFTPHVHDEHSYLFQAQTFLLGRLVNPPHPEHLFFDQIHVINEGIYASKYFPGFAVTLLPFVALDVPYLNPIVFYGLQMILVFLLGKELFGEKTAWVGLVLVAVSPQIVVPSTLLLSHLPCAVFLLLFFWAFLKWERRGWAGWALLSGFAWTAGFLTRPLTAVGFAAPVAIRLVYLLLKGRVRSPFRASLAWCIPLACALLLYGGYNKSVTGSFFEAPFDHYAELHTPYHRYGFNNWVKYADQAAGPRVYKRFNELYPNHTPLMGLQVAEVRLRVFTQFLLGFSLLGFLALGCWLLQLRKRDARHLLIFSCWVSLQLAHVPHFYPGMISLNSNYLYEASALVLLAIAHLIVLLFEHPVGGKWKRALLLAGFLAFLGGSVWTCSAAGEQIRQGKRLPLRVEAALEERHADRALIFVRLPDYLNLTWDAFGNVPTLDSRIVFARDRGPLNSRLFPYFQGYQLYLLDLHKAQLLPIRTSPPRGGR